MRHITHLILGLNFIFLLPSSAMAARVHISVFQNEEVYVASHQARLLTGDVYSIFIVLDTEGKIINTVSGEVVLPGNIHLEEVVTSPSVVDLWVEEPSLDGNNIGFSGSIIGGYNGENAALFELRVSPIIPGTSNIEISTIELYAHDGFGTEISVTATGLECDAVEASAINSPVTPATTSQTPPAASVQIPDSRSNEAFSPIVMRTPEIFGGRWFLAFESANPGTVRFEVKEGADRFRTATSPYLLRDQSLRSDIIVRVINEAGEVQEVKIPAKAGVEFPGNAPHASYWYILGGLILVFSFEAWRIIMAVTQSSKPPTRSARR